MSTIRGDQGQHIEGQTRVLKDRKAAARLGRLFLLEKQRLSCLSGQIVREDGGTEAQSWKGRAN